VAVLTDEEMAQLLRIVAPWYAGDGGTATAQGGEEEGRRPIPPPTRELSEEEVRTVVEALRDCMIKGHRNAVNYRLVAMMIEAGVTRDSAKKVVEALMTTGRAPGTPEEIQSELANVDYHYRNDPGEARLEGRPSLVAECTKALVDAGTSLDAAVKKADAAVGAVANVLRSARPEEPVGEAPKMMDIIAEIWIPARRDELSRILLAWAREVGEEKAGEVKRALMGVAQREGTSNWVPDEGEPDMTLVEYLERAQTGQTAPLEVVEKLQEAMGKPSRVAGVVLIRGATTTQYLVIDYVRNIVHPAKRIRVKDDWTALVPDNPTILFAAPDMAEIRARPDGYLFAVRWRRRDGSIVETIGDAEEIVSRLQSSGVVGSRNRVHDAVSAILDFMMTVGWAKKVDAAPPGVYVEGDKLRVVWPHGSPPEGDLAEALGAIDELAKWYRPEILATVMKWGIASPLSYAVRKLGGVFPGLVLYGPRDTGKSTLARVATAYMWGRSANDLIRSPDEAGERAFAGSGESVATAYRIEQLGGGTTFPIIIDEANSIFILGRGRVENVDALNYLKAATSSVGGRGRKRGWGWEAREVLATFVLTLNPTPPVDFSKGEWEGKTFVVVPFTLSDRRGENEMHEFNSKVPMKLPALAALGRFALERIVSKGLEWLRDRIVAARVEAWEVIGRELVEEAYREVGKEPPGWLDLSASARMEEARREAEEGLRWKVIERLQVAIYDAYMMALKELATSRGGEVMPTHEWVGRIRMAAESRVVPWLRVVSGKTGEDVVFASSVLEVINSKGDLQIGGLKDLADLMGWQYGVVFSRAAQINMKGIRVRLADLVELFESESNNVDDGLESN
jgi:hypothetical protein